MKSRLKNTVPEKKPIIFERADPKELAKFNPNSKECTMNCGPHADDPRNRIERKFLCDDCFILDV